MSVDFSQLTEMPGMKATKEQLARIFHRYRFARDLAENREVLEVACGSGIGLGFISKKARYVIGGDIDWCNLQTARRLYNNKSVSLCKLDAHYLPFNDKQFDLILLFEAIYYLKYPDLFVNECKRVLRNGGFLVICMVNKNWEDFHPSPHAFHYFSVPELYNLLAKFFTDVKFYGAFPVCSRSFSDCVVSLLKRIAVRLNLIPNTLAGRTYLKRLFIGKLEPIPEEIYEDMAPYEQPILISPHEKTDRFKIIYSVSKL